MLGISNTTQVVAKLDDDERSMFNIGRQGDANITLDILPMLEEEAKERMIIGGKEHGRGMEKGSAEMQHPIEESKGRAAEQAAALVGASARRVYDMKKTLHMKI